MVSPPTLYRVGESKRLLVESMSTCPSKQRRLKHWQADQRRIARGSHETLHQTRYVVSSSPELPCVEATRGRRRGQRTTCIPTREHSPSRSRCRLLLSSGDYEDPDLARFVASLPPGMHFSGVGHVKRSGFDLPALFTGDVRAAPYEVTVLGPFVDVVTKKLDLVMVSTMDFVDLDPEDGFAWGGFFDRILPNRSFPGGPLAVRYAPTLAMIRKWVSFLRMPPPDLVDVRDADPFVHIATNATRFADGLQSRLADLAALRYHLSRTPTDRRAAQKMVKYAFQWAMYERRWAGPGTPYPVSRARNVGTASNPVSPKLVDSAVGNGLRSEHDMLPADHVVDGRLQNMAVACRNACLDVAEENKEVALRLKMSAIVHVVDGSYYPDLASLPGFLNECASASDAANLHQNTLHTIRSCKMLAAYVYGSEPSWIKFEGEAMPLRSMRR